MHKLTASELRTLIDRHIEACGDGPVFVFDSHEASYKTIDASCITQTPLQGQPPQLVIECPEF